MFVCCYYVVLIFIFLEYAFPLENLRFGMEIVQTAYNVVCWYENLKMFPPPTSDNFGSCYNLQLEITESLSNPELTLTKEQITVVFSNLSNTVALPMLPSYYKASCCRFLDHPESSFPSYMKGDILDDKGRNYPFKRFAYCLIDTLEKHHGKEAVESKNEKVYKRKHWKQVVLDQANKARGRHGLGSLKMKKELNRDAEFYARQMASKCVYGHSTPETRMLQGELTGENISGRIGGDPLDISLSSVNAYYNEIQYYPYSAVVGEGKLVEAIEAVQTKGIKIGHFIQLCWKSTRYVGYGLAYNYKCSENTTAPWKAYYVERYYPAYVHNASMYRANILPPKE